MLGQYPQHSNEIKTNTESNEMDPPENKEAHKLTLNFSLDQRLDVDPSYLRLHHNTMHVNWYKYIEYISMRIGMLKHKHILERKSEELAWLNSTRLNSFQHKAIQNK